MAANSKTETVISPLTPPTPSPKPASKSASKATSKPNADKQNVDKPTIEKPKQVKKKEQESSNRYIFRGLKKKGPLKGRSAEIELQPVRS